MANEFPLRPEQNCCYISDDSFKGIFFDEKVWLLIKISFKFVPKGTIDIGLHNDLVPNLNNELMFAKIYDAIWHH